MIKKIIASINKYRMLNIGDTVVVAVSGGPDSVALLKFLADISARYKLKLIVAHFNHALRGEESDQDERFVSELASKLGLTCETGRADVAVDRSLKKAAIEDSARKERYKFLAEVAGKHAALKIALGHNLQDQSETIIMNLLRGSGTEGLRGILPVREEMFIRPLLGITRKEILDYLKTQRLEFRTDSSNLSIAFQRNRVRHQLIPELKKKYNPRLEEQLGRLGEIVRLEDELINSLVFEILDKWGVALNGKETEISIEKLTSLQEALQRRIFKIILESFSPQRNGIEYHHIRSVIKLCRYGSPHGSLNLPFGIKIKRTYSKVHICNKKELSGVGLFSYFLEIPGEIAVSEAGIIMKSRFVDAGLVDFSNQKTAYLDYDTMVCPLQVRNFRHGDRIEPLGLNGSQKIKKIFIDQKIDMDKRMIIPMVADSLSVLWIPGIKFSERVKVSHTTKRVIEIEIV
jgi:tRNA(Ile)-lysidine synthase